MCVMFVFALISDISFAESSLVFIKGGGNTVCMTYEEASNGRLIKLIKPKIKAIYPKELKFRYIQTGLWLTAIFPREGVNLPYEFDVANDSGGDEKTSNKYCISQFDFDKDGIPEIILAVVDSDVENDGEGGFAGASVNVFRFTPPLFEKDSTRQEQWQLIGNITNNMVVGVPSVEITAASITIPRNHRGFYKEITWVKERFVDTSEY